ncbi:MAG: amidohydrolase family protein [Victivallaceae bacterium]|nr:amidohydrolase family protein [Victivallaceae bacterium]
MKFIDIHAHAFRRPVPYPVKFCSPDELVARYDAAGIEMGCLLPIVSPEIYLPQANEEILEMVSERPDRFFAFCNIDPRALTFRSDAPLCNLLEYYRERGCKGVGEIMPNMRMDDPMVMNLFACAEKTGMPVTCDGSDRVGADFGLYDAVGLPIHEKVLRTFPNLKMIGHGPIFWVEYAPIPEGHRRKPAFLADGTQEPLFYPEGPITGEGAMQRLLRTYDNLYVELSDGCAQLRRDLGFAAKFLTEFQDRVFFGTDLCCFTHPFLIKDVIDELHDRKLISETVFAKIVRENAIRFFGLEVE